MKSKLEIPAKKRRHITNFFIEAFTCRIPLPVTKVIVYTDRTSYPICPKCSMSLDREYMAFCDRCGQRLNWDFFEYAQICRPDCQRK